MMGFPKEPIEQPNRWPWYCIFAAITGAIFTSYLLAMVARTTVRAEHEQEMARLEAAKICFQNYGQGCINILIPDYVETITDSETTDEDATSEEPQELPDEEYVDPDAEDKVCKPEGVEL